MQHTHVAFVILLLSATTTGGNWKATAQQPKVITLERLPAKRSAGIISLPEGSPWCRGAPTIMLAGHQNSVVDTPNCFINGQWRKPMWAKLDIIDDLNAADGPREILDRHACGTMDINNDGRLDLYCLIGADKGLGRGYNEVYITQKNGRLFKIRRHALHKFIGARTRHTTTLRGANNTELLFISASFGRRPDGRLNKHAMFKKTGNYNGNKWWRRYFDHMRGPWQIHSNATCAIAADVNGDSLDDLILCNTKIESTVLVQRPDGTFNKNLMNQDEPQKNWRNARVADFDGDGLPDLAVVYDSQFDSFLRVFKGIPESPYFEFTKRAWYARPLPFAAPDLEAFDADGDGILDLYIVQANERTNVPNNYCGGHFVAQNWWTGGASRILPPTNYVPPRDTAPDLLLIGRRGDRYHRRFREVVMEHSEPGCGYFVKKFGERSLVLAQGGFDRPGHQLLLEF